MSGTDPCSAPLQVLTTPELFQQGPSSLTGASDVVVAVENEFAADPGAFSAEHPLTVFGYGQSATAESIARARLEQAGIPSDELHFVFIGDPSNPVDGIWSNLQPDLDSLFGSNTANSIINFLDFNGVLGSVTPDDLYPTTIYTLDTGGIADFQQDFNAGGLLDPILHTLFQHVEYLGLTPAQIADATTSTTGDLTNIDISDNINNLGALLDAFGHGVATSGLFESIVGSVELFVDNSF